MDKNNSPALTIVKTIWDEMSRKSWTKLNKSLRDAVSLAIESGIEWSQGDFEYIFENMNGWRWFYSDGGYYGEWMYSKACAYSNSSAYKSFEAWRGRKPFVLDGERLCVGRKFLWRGEELKVTGFTKNQEQVVACSYKDAQITYGDHVYDTQKLKKAHKINHSDIYEWNRERRKLEMATTN